MTKVKGVALASYREQIAGGDTEPVHPDVIKVLNQHIRVSVGFESSWVIGMTSRVWREDDGISFEADINEDALRSALIAKSERDGRPFTMSDIDTAAIGYSLEIKDGQGRLIKGGTLYEIGLVEPDQNMNKAQPRLEVE